MSLGTVKLSPIRILPKEYTSFRTTGERGIGTPFSIFGISRRLLPEHNQYPNVNRTFVKDWGTLTDGCGLPMSPGIAAAPNRPRDFAFQGGEMTNSRKGVR
jgi:hypothetical protein